MSVIRGRDESEGFGSAASHDNAPSHQPRSLRSSLERERFPTSSCFGQVFARNPVFPLTTVLQLRRRGQQDGTFQTGRTNSGYRLSLRALWLSPTSAIDFGQFRLRPAFFFKFGQFDFGQFLTSANSTSANYWMLNFGMTKCGALEGWGAQRVEPRRVEPRRVEPRRVEQAGALKCARLEFAGCRCETPAAQSPKFHERTPRERKKKEN